MPRIKKCTQINTTKRITYTEEEIADILLKHAEMKDGEVDFVISQGCLLKEAVVTERITETIEE